MNKGVKRDVLVVSGDGINCEIETARAFEQAGATTSIVLTNELLDRPSMILDHQILAFPGGFSYGDEIRSGKLLAEKLRTVATDQLEKFRNQGGLMIGICNGFQILMQLGLFAENLGAVREQTLKTNASHQFLNRWVELELSTGAKNSPWLKSLPSRMWMPMRHKEGRIFGDRPDSSRVAFKYLEDVNGAIDQIAALLDPTGQVLGIMPHPEAALQPFLYPSTISNAESHANAARQIFKNAVEHIHSIKTENRS